MLSMHRQRKESNKVKSNITISGIVCGCRQLSCTLTMETGQHMLCIREDLPVSLQSSMCLTLVWEDWDLLSV